MKKRIIVASLLALLLLGTSLGYAWYHNNRQVELLGGSGVNSTIKIRSGGVLQAAYAVEDNFTVIPIGNATFASSLEMKLDGNSYGDVTGNGLMEQMFSPELGEDGVPQMNVNWELAKVDNAAVDGDSGQYIVADLYFRSDVPMDIYLLKESCVRPKTQANGADLTNRSGYENKPDFLYYPNGLPSLNINQSSYGLFSRNLIAGAARVSFTEYDFDGGAFPTVPGVIWVPNAQYQLIKGGPGELSKVELKGVKESAYSYFKAYTSGTPLYRAKSVPRRETNENRIDGELYRVLTDGNLEPVVKSGNVDTVVKNGVLMPGYKPEHLPAVPAIWDPVSSKYIPAALVTDSEGEEYLVAADYRENIFSDSTAAYRSMFGGTSVNVQTTEDGYMAVTREDDQSEWVPTGVVYTGDDAKTIEAGFRRDKSEYVTTVWIDDDDFQQKDDVSYSCCRIGSTEKNNGFYYTRIQIAIWVEGTDNEADIRLNGGEFNINLQFYGVAKEVSAA